MPQATDRNLLVGILALQFDFVTRDRLIEAMTVWASNKGDSLESIFFERKWIDSRTKELLSGLADKCLRAELAQGPANRNPRPTSNESGGLTSHPSLPKGVDRELIQSLHSQLASLPDASIQMTLATMLPKHDQSTLRPDSFETLVPSPAQERGARYRILHLHAKGGLGEVSVAFDNELHRQVALKQIQSHYADDPSARQRFVLEAEVTGGLEHPGVVPVYGMGTFGDGRPFYAMRFIRGESLRDATDGFHRSFPAPHSGSGVLELRKLLGRFIDVCQAIEYSHSRGVLHRDLKPENIMLGPYGETLVVDWGLAKTVGQDDITLALKPNFDLEPKLIPSSGSGTAPTELGSVIGTPAFMSPEQAAGRVDQIGPLSDVYSLGATLYYVLTGRTAFDTRRKQDAAVDLGRVLRQVTQGDFPRPREVHKTIPKALEAICLRAMDRMPSKRYASSREMAEDLERFLADEPVQALKDSVLVTALRWVRRHPALTSTAAAMVLLSALGLGGFTTILSAKQRELTQKNSELLVAQAQAVKSAEEAEKGRQQAEAARISAEQSEVFANRAQANTFAFSEFLIDHILATARPKGQEGGLGIGVSVVEALRAAEPVIDTLFENNPEAEASTRSGIGRTWYALGDYQRAKVHQQRVRELLEPKGLQDVQHLKNLHELSSTLRALGETEESIRIQEQVLAAFRNLESPASRHVLISENNLAISYGLMGRTAEATALYEHVLQEMLRQFPQDSPEVISAEQNLVEGLRYGEATQRARAKEIFQRLLEKTERVLGEAHPDNLIGVNNFANFLCEEGDTAEAIALHERTTWRMESALGPEHPTTLIAKANLGSSYVKDFQFNKALPILQSAWKAQERVLSADHPDTLNTLDIYANALSSAGQIAESLTLFEQAYAGRKRVLGATNLETLTTLNNMATVYDQAQEHARAIELNQECLKLRRSILPATDPVVISTLYNLGFSYLMAGDSDKGIAAFAEHSELLLQTEGAQSPNTWSAFLNLATAQSNTGSSTEALASSTRAVDMMRQHLPADDIVLASGQATLALIYLQAEEFNSARELLTLAVKNFRAALSPVGEATGDIGRSIELRGMLVNLALAETGLGNFEAAEVCAAESVAMAEVLLPNDWRLFNARSVLGNCLTGTQQFEKAEELLLAAHEALEARQAEIPSPIRYKFTLASFDRIIELYRSLKQESQVEAWQQNKRQYQSKTSQL